MAKGTTGGTAHRAVKAPLNGKRPRAARLNPEERRRKIVEAARSVFTEHGLAGARTRQIADAAGVVEGVIYRHFSSKEELFEAAILEPLEELVDQMARVTPTFAAVDSKARRARSEEMHRQFLKTMLEVTPLLNVALFADRAAGKKFYRERVEPVITRSTKAYEEALSTWSHPPSTTASSSSPPSACTSPSPSTPTCATPTSTSKPPPGS